MTKVNLMRRVLRHLAYSYELNYVPISVESFEFSPTDVLEYLADLGVQDFTEVASSIIRDLEENGYIKTIGETHFDPAYKKFTLTTLGYQAGASKIDSWKILLIVSINSLSAIKYGLLAIGIIGGPLALINTASGVVDWVGPISWLAQIWEGTIIKPVSTILTWLPFTSEGVPKWLSGYIAIGVLIFALFVHLRQQREIQYFLYTDSLILIILKTFWLTLAATLIMALWPLVLLSQLIISCVLLYGFRYDRDNLGHDIRTKFSPVDLIYEISLYVFPTLIFIVLAISNKIAQQAGQ